MPRARCRLDVHPLSPAVRELQGGTARDIREPDRRLAARGRFAPGHARQAPQRRPQGSEGRSRRGRDRGAGRPVRLRRALRANDGTPGRRRLLLLPARVLAAAQGARRPPRPLRRSGRRRGGRLGALSPRRALASLPPGSDRRRRARSRRVEPPALHGRRVGPGAEARGVPPRRRSGREGGLALRLQGALQPRKPTRVLGGASSSTTRRRTGAFPGARRSICPASSRPIACPGPCPTQPARRARRSS